MMDPEQVISRLLLAPTLVVAAGILVKGYSQPGDGFAAGMVVALGLLLQYIVFGRVDAERMLPIPILARTAALGCLICFAVAFIPVLMGRPVLTHFPGAGDQAITFATLEIGTVLAFDLGVALLVVGAVTGILAIIGTALDETRDA